MEKVDARSETLNAANQGLTWRTATSAIAICTFLSAPAFAQNISADVDGAGIQEIIVTAQKRAQNLQDVPIAITALTQEALENNRIRTVSDLTGLAPGLQTKESPGNIGTPTLVLRGIFGAASVPSQDKETSVYLDGVYLGGSRGAVFDLPDIERVEVLRGPQGTLFGRNSTAGAISIVTREPDGKFGGRQELTVGNYAQFRTRTTVSTPQIGPFAGYVTYVHDERHGDVRNLGAGVVFDRTNPFTSVGARKSAKYLGDRNNDNIFAALRFTPTDTLKMVYKFDRVDSKNTAAARTTSAINPNSVIGQMLLGIIAAQPAGGGRFGPVTLNPSQRRPKAANNAFVQRGFNLTSGHSLTTDFEASDSLSFKNVAAYRRATTFGTTPISGLDGLEFTDAARTPYARFAAISSLGAGFFALPAAAQNATVAAIAQRFAPNVGQYFAAYSGQSYGRGHQYSDEMQANYDSDFMTLTVGALYYRSKELGSGLPGYTPNYVFAPVPTTLPLGNVSENRSATKSIAAYSQAEFHVTPQFDIIVGGRITKDKKSGSSVAGGTFVGTPAGGSITGTTFAPFEFKKTKPTYSIGLNYTTDDGNLFYGKFSTAFLSGGAVGGVQGGVQRVYPFAPETVKSGELGMKADFFDRRLRVNAAVYRAVYKHTQGSSSGSSVVINGVAQTSVGVIVVDNGTQKVNGVELDVTVAPTNGLTLGTGVALTDAKATSPSPFITQGQPYKLQNISKVVGQTYVQYETMPIFGDAILSLRVDANYNTKYRSLVNANIANTIPAFAPYEYSPGRVIVNGRAALKKINVGPLTGEVAVWGRNLTNNKDPLFPFQFGDFQFHANFQEARTYGLDFSLSF